jgi:hypothetical protein
MTLKNHFRMTASELAMGRYMRAPDHAAATMSSRRPSRTSERMSQLRGQLTTRGVQEMDGSLVSCSCWWRTCWCCWRWWRRRLEPR